VVGAAVGVRVSVGWRVGVGTGVLVGAGVDVPFDIGALSGTDVANSAGVLHADPTKIITSQKIRMDMFLVTMLLMVF
jgi:hypothetical protein